MKARASLLDRIKAEAAAFGITVHEAADGIELEAPGGMQFDTELHVLVTSQWDNEPMPNVLRRALADIREYGPRMKPCPPYCPCKETD